MTTTRLLILGAVRERGTAHGYQVRRDLESWGVHLWGSIQQGSIYHGLRKLRDEGMLREVASTGNPGGKSRTEYAITEAGQGLFVELLENALRSDDGDLAGTIAGVGFMTELTRARAVELLRARVDAYTRRRAQVVGEYERSDGADWQHHIEAVRLWAYTADTALEWTRDLVGRLEGGAYAMAGEPGGRPAPPPADVRPRAHGSAPRAG